MSTYEDDDDVGAEEPQGDEDWDGVAGSDGADIEEEPACSLFSSRILPSAAVAMNYDAAEHGFDIRVYRRQVSCVDQSYLQVMSDECLAGLGMCCAHVHGHEQCSATVWAAAV